MGSASRLVRAALQLIPFLLVPISVLAQQPGAAPAAADSVAPAVGDTLPADSVRTPPLSASADSVLQLLRQLEGFTVTEYRGTAAEYRVDEGVLRLEGAAEVTRGGDRLTADTIVYRERLELVEAYGAPTVTGEGQEIAGDTLYYDLATRRATALGARTQITDAATWHVRGDMTLEGESRLFASHASFTSCDLAIPHYHFESDEVMVIRDQILVARPARLYFGNVPVMVLPFVVHNLEQGRRSGFLTPRLGVHDVVRASSGYNRQISDVGFYWAINEYMGAQVSTTWRSGAFTALNGEYNFRWRRQFLDGRVGFERYWKADGDRELNLNANGGWQPDERTSMNLSGRFATSEEFVRDASYDPRETTQDLQSSLSLRRTFDWGSASLGGDRRQSIANGDVSMTLPSVSLSPQQVTLFRAPTPEQASWYSNATLSPGVLTFSRSVNDYADNVTAGRQDRNSTRFRVSPSFSVGNLYLSASGQLNRSEILEVAGVDPIRGVVDLPGFNRDDADWAAEMRYQQTLIGATNLSPKISLSQQLVRDTLTTGELLRAPTRLSFGADLNTDLYGFFPGIASFSAIRHKLSPRMSYSYSPEVEQTELQERVFGRPGGRAQNRVTLGVSQTWEAKLSEPREVEESIELVDSISADSVAAVPSPSVPSDPQKVTLLSLNTSAVAYDFIQAREEGTGFTTTTISNSVGSDYLRGLSIQMQHELFDRTGLDPNDSANAGQLGIFAPKLTSLSTSFRLGPESAVVRWLERFGFGADEGISADEGVVPGDEAEDAPAPQGQGTFTNNPQGTGGGPWSAAIGYRFSRPSRLYSEIPRDLGAVQTLDGNISFQLSPNWSVQWDTSYSLTDREFGSHIINFQRDLHEWQANFNFYQTANGNTAFEFYVELTHARDLRFDYAERNLGIDRNR
ncbi:MAG: putative LPS assembly protein LptD [Gemmatimonadota bacterium]